MVKVFIALCLWLLLFAISWPLAIVAVLFTPLAALLMLPFLALVFVLKGAFSLVFGLIKRILLLPAWLFGWRPVSS